MHMKYILYDIVVFGKNYNDDNIHDFISPDIERVKEYCNVWGLDCGLIRAYKSDEDGEPDYNDADMYVEGMEFLEEEEASEVRCVCSTCYGEGWTFVSAERAKELKKKNLMEECCPFGDKCNKDDDSEEEEEEEEAANI